VNSAMIERRPADSGQALPDFRSPHRISSASRLVGVSSGAVAGLEGLGYGFMILALLLAAPSAVRGGVDQDLAVGAVLGQGDQAVGD
jgi:hypothetical protein